MIEHEPWRGPDCESGINGHRIAIVGYSHHRDPKHEDFNLITNCVLERIARGETIGDSFFPRVPGYFGFKSTAEFWNRVWFFNLIPECIGISDQKYGTANGELLERAKRRFTKILRDEKPNIQKVFVLSMRGWAQCPYTAQEEGGKDCTRLGADFGDFSWGRYVFSDHTVTAFGLRHPQFANKIQMVGAVQRALSII
jgi:hypothetical protein